MSETPWDKFESTPKTWQDRVRDEKKELDFKRSRLAAFYGTQVWCDLPVQEKGRLRRQQDVMNEYSSILGERIAAFSEPEPTPTHHEHHQS